MPSVENIGSEVRGPTRDDEVRVMAGMSWAMIVGLAVSTMLTLLVVPTLYSLFAPRFRTSTPVSVD